MKKFMIVVMLIPVLVLAQTTIPYPTGMKTYREDFPDEPPRTNIYLIVNSNAEPYIDNSQNIGDFNGDGSEEIYSIWFINADFHYTSNGVDTVFYNAESIGGYTVYSLKTQSIVLYEIRCRYSFPSTVKTGDFNGDDCIDYVIADKIYTTSTPIKKKLH